MHLQEIQLTQFKNYAAARLSLSPQVNCFTGNNGAGKTNLLDAVYYLSFTKSFFSGMDLQHIRHGDDFFSIEGTFVKGTLEELVRITVQKGEKKSVRVNHNEHKKFSDHIGCYPLVMITPNDAMLIHEGSEERRKFLDGMISQTDKVYLNDLLLYNRVLEQRNRQLKLFAEMQYFDRVLMDTYNDQLAKTGTAIHEKRRMFLAAFIPVFRQYYEEISSSAEQVDLVYDSALNETDLATLLSQHENHDLAAQRTTKGIHRDELEFMQEGLLLKKFGSQGQQKSFIISLKLAQYMYLKEHTGIKPLLLLDDIFEKLDEKRLNKLLQMIAEDNFGQLFISDTHVKRLQEVFGQMPQVDTRYFVVNEGKASMLQASH